MFGAGVLSALDTRNSSSVAPVLQLSSYLTGLSGGAWLVGSLLLSGLPDLFSLALGGSEQPGWLLDLNLLAPGDTDASLNEAFYTQLMNEVQLKADAGAPVSVADLWSRALARHFFNGTTRANFFDQTSPHDAGLLWSAIRDVPLFQTAQAPITIALTSSRIAPTAAIVPLSNTVRGTTPLFTNHIELSMRAGIRVYTVHLGLI